MKERERERERNKRIRGEYDRKKIYLDRGRRCGDGRVMDVHVELRIRVVEHVVQVVHRRLQPVRREEVVVLLIVLGTDVIEFLVLVSWVGNL